MRAYSDKSYRNYFKKATQSWTNPFLTSNTTWGVIEKTSADDKPMPDVNIWRAFNGSENPGLSTYTFWGNTAFRIKWKMPQKVRVNKIQMWGSHAPDTYYSVTGFYAWAWDYSTGSYEQLCSDSWNPEQYVVASWDVTEIETDLFRFEVTGRPTFEGYRPTALREIRLSGSKVDIVKGTASDYDYYVDSPEIKARLGDIYSEGVIRKGYQALGHYPGETQEWKNCTNNNMGEIVG